MTRPNTPMVAVKIMLRRICGSGDVVLITA